MLRTARMRIVNFEPRTRDGDEDIWDPFRGGRDQRMTKRSDTFRPLIEITPRVRGYFWEEIVTVKEVHNSGTGVP